MLLQAEIAGRLLPSLEGYPAKGSVIRDFQLRSAKGWPVLLSEYRGRSNIVLVLAGEADLAGTLLSDLARHQTELNENEVRALAIVAGPPERAAGAEMLPSSAVLRNGLADCREKLLPRR